MLRNPLRALAPRGKAVAAALVLAASALFAGPAAEATAQASQSRTHQLVEAPGAVEQRDAERALGARLALGYAGAVPAADVEALVREVSRRLRQDASPSNQLPDTTEAVARRALTDFLTRGTPLPIG